MATQNNIYLDYDGLKQYSQSLLGIFALKSKTPELDANGIVKSQYLPNYMDDIEEYASLSAFPKTGDLSKLYVAKDTGDMYRWSGSQYNPMLSASGIAAEAKKVSNKLTFGSKTYDGSAATTLTASDLGALTSHQKIYKLSVTVGTNAAVVFNPTSSDQSISITKSGIGLGNVENTALSSWAGSKNITTLGTITTGVWHGSKIENAYLSNSKITIGSTEISLGGTATAIAGLTSIKFSGATGALTYDTTNKYYKLNDNLVVDGSLASGTSGTGGGGSYSQMEWADIKTMSATISGSLASAYAVKQAYSELSGLIGGKASSTDLSTLEERVTAVENKYVSTSTEITEFKNQAATTAVLGLLKIYNKRSSNISATSSGTSGLNCGVELGADNKAFVNVPIIALTTEQINEIIPAVFA